MDTTRITTKGQIVIPVEIRRSLKLSPGMEFFVSVEQGRVILEPKPAQPSQITDWQSRNPQGVKLTTQQLCAPVNLIENDRP